MAEAALDPVAALTAIFDAERSLRAAERKLLESPEAKGALVQAVETALALEEGDESQLRLERLADLCAQIPGPEMADAMIAILDSPTASVRVAAGEALLDVAYEYYAEVARAIDRTLDAGERIRALSELPFLLAEVGEPSAAKQLRRFLEHADPSVVAAGIEASVGLADAEMGTALGALVEDTRDVSIIDFEAETRATIGELAREAIAHLERELDAPER